MTAIRRTASTANGVVTLLTDFGRTDGFAGIMKGVMLRANPRVRLVDLTHEIPPQDVVAGALVLRSAVPFFPRSTVHLAVVDPGVGGARRALVVATRTALFVGPDNGLLLPAAQALGITGVRAIDVERLLKRKVLREPISRTFQGRDVFAPVAAWLSTGAAVSAVGPVVRDPVELHLPVGQVQRNAIDGEVIYVDRFGNLITNITGKQLARFPTQRVSVSIGRVRIRGLSTAYAAAPVELLAIVGSWGLLEIAARNASAAARLSAARGTRVHVTVS
ncbi:MAG TPA: SAM-dependent chlorinase/fluorinase [Candidatus Binatia bacterium]|nr:SAM-dependent chlorinase/fluorinase [Candidatus Binatia bacterium]